MATRERMTESLEPYEPPEADYDWDYDEQPARRDAPKVLWGRVAILGAGVLVAFFIGRMTAPDGVPASDLQRAERRAEDARAEVAALRDRVSNLETQLQDAEAAATATDTTDTTDATEEDDTTAPEGDTETHVVAAGETLTTISEEYYGNAGYADYIAEFNGLADASSIPVGMELEIPPEPEG